jgi:hypothetical protein
MHTKGEVSSEEFHASTHLQGRQASADVHAYMPSAACPQLQERTSICTGAGPAGHMTQLKDAVGVLLACSAISIWFSSQGPWLVDMSQMAVTFKLLTAPLQLHVLPC